MADFIKALRLSRKRISAYTVPFNAQKLASFAEEDEIALLKDWADHNQR